MDTDEKKKRLKELKNEAGHVQSLIDGLSGRLTIIVNDIDSELLDNKLSHYNFEQRTINCLNKAEIFTVGDLLKWKKSKLMKIRGFGISCLKDIEEFLKENKFTMQE